MFVASALFGDKWTGNRALRGLPAYRRDGGYKTQVFVAEPKRHRGKSKPVVVPRGLREEFREAHQMFFRAREAITEAVIEGRLRGMVEPANGVSFGLDHRRTGLLGDQLQTIFMTGYVPLDSGRSYGLVVFEMKRLEQFVLTTGGATPTTPGGWLGHEIKALHQLAKDYVEDLTGRLPEEEWPAVTHKVLDDLRDVIVDVVRPGHLKLGSVSERQFQIHATEAFRIAGVTLEGGSPPKLRRKGSGDLGDFLKRRSTASASNNPTNKT